MLCAWNVVSLRPDMLSGLNWPVGEPGSWVSLLSPFNVRFELHGIKSHELSFACNFLFPSTRKSYTIARACALVYSVYTYTAALKLSIQASTAARRSPVDHLQVQLEVIREFGTLWISSSEAYFPPFSAFENSTCSFIFHVFISYYRDANCRISSNMMNETQFANGISMFKLHNSF